MFRFLPQSEWGWPRDEKDCSDELRVCVDAFECTTLQDVMIKASKVMKSRYWLDINWVDHSDYRDIVMGWLYEQGKRKVFLELRLHESLLVNASYRDAFLFFDVFHTALASCCALSKLSGYDDRGFHLLDGGFQVRLVFADR